MRQFRACYSGFLRKAALAALTSTALVSGASAQTITNRIIAFGDSLSDNGNAFALVGAQPGGPYTSGRFTNDRVFVEYLGGTRPIQTSGALSLVLGQPLSTGSVDFAFGGSRTDTLATPFPGIQTQINGFVALGGRIAASDVVTLWGGANDLFQGIQGAAAVPATATTVFGGIATRAATNTAAQAQQLASLGARTIVVIGLPDFARLPLFAGGPASQLASFGSSTFNTALLAGLANVARANPGTNIVSIDTATTFNAIIANPGRFGISNTTIPCISLATCNNALFFDPVHPTAIGQQVVAAVVFNNLAINALVNPVQALADIGFETRRNAVISSFEQLAAIKKTGDKPEYFLTVTGDRIERDADRIRPNFAVTTGGLRFGAIRSIDDAWRVGLAINGATGVGTANAISFSPTNFSADGLVGWTHGRYFVNGALGAGYQQFRDYERPLVGLPLRNTATVGGYTLSASTEAGINYNFGNIELTPQVRFAYLYSTINRFTESGDAAQVQFASRGAEGFTGAVELKAATYVTKNVKVNAVIGYEDLITGAGEALRGQLVNSTALPINIATRQPVGSGVLFGAGLQAQISANISLSAYYRGSALNTTTHHQGNIGVNAKF